MELKKENITSIGELACHDGGRRLTPVFNGEVFPKFVYITNEEFQVVRGDKDKMKDLAIKKLNTFVKVGLKANAKFLFSQMGGETLGGCGGGILYSSIVYLNGGQFDKFKSLVEQFGYDIEKSLTKISEDKDVDFCCYLDKV